jgi:beclin 1
MVAFLDCLKGLIDNIKAQDPTVDFPHQSVIRLLDRCWFGWFTDCSVARIVKDKIGDVSVKLQFSQEDAWTRALRHVLLALKILLKWATSGNNA